MSQASRPTATVGPESRPGVQCVHPEIEIDIDPEDVLLADCEREAGFFVPIEGGDPVGLCSFHLARFLEDADDALEAELVDRGARDHAASPSFVRFGDAPPTVIHDDERWDLLAVDQHGRAHYTHVDSDDVVQYHPRNEPERVSIADLGRYLEQLRHHIGFVDVSSDVREAADFLSTQDDLDAELITDGGVEPVTFEQLIEVCETVTPDDEVELSTTHYEYKNPLSVESATVVRWEGGGWRTARLVLEGSYGTNHPIIGVEGGRGPFHLSSGQEYEVHRLEPVGVDLEDDDSPLAPEDSPHKYETGDAIENIPGAENGDEPEPLTDGARQPWSELDVDPPPDLTPEELEAAVAESDRLYDVCRVLGLRPTDRGLVRVLCINEGLYERLQMPEGRQEAS